MNKAARFFTAPIRFARKALTAMRFAGHMPFIMGMLARTKFDYGKAVGSGIDSSVVTAPVQWIQRALPEARLRVVRGRGDDKQEVEDHALVVLVNMPNTFYSGDHLWSVTALSYLIAGNAYWIIVRNSVGRPVELWWVPWWCMEPKWPQDGSEFISHYEYKPGGTAPIRLEVEDVVHFRHGIDPRNPRLGLSPMHGCLREIFMDLESSNFVAALLRNLGIPGVIVSPDGGAVASPEDVKANKAWFRENFGGDNRGEPMFMGAATKVQQFGFSPQQMDLSPTRNVAEERVCASLGIPAAVVGFGAGLQTAKVGATMRELRGLAWSNGVLPLLRSLAGELERSLLPQMGGGDGERVEHDTSEVIALEDELKTRAERYNIMIAGQWARVSEGREAMGLDVTDADDVYLRSFSTVEVPAGAPPRLPPVDDADPATEPDNAISDDAGSEEPGPEQRALPGVFASKHGFKQDRAEPRPAQLAFVAALERMEGPLGDAMAARLLPFFAALGRVASVAASPLLEAADIEPPKSVKQTGEDEVLVGRILEAMGLADQQTAFKQVYEAHYLQVADEVAKAGELIGLGTNLPDAVARTVTAAGGRRSGLVDLTDQSRRAMFDALAEGRAAGEGAEQLAERIADHVEAGPWQSPETRARIIARTETKFAQNISTVARARDAGVDQFMIFDGRLGPGRSVPEHIARNGTIVTADQAQELAALEHPNGTLSFSPHFADPEEQDT